MHNVAHVAAAGTVPPLGSELQRLVPLSIELLSNTPHCFIHILNRDGG